LSTSVDIAASCSADNAPSLGVPPLLTTRFPQLQNAVGEQDHAISPRQFRSQLPRIWVQAQGTQDGNASASAGAPKQTFFLFLQRILCDNTARTAQVTQHLHLFTFISSLHSITPTTIWKCGSKNTLIKSKSTCPSSHQNGNASTKFCYCAWSACSSSWQSLSLRFMTRYDLSV